MYGYDSEQGSFTPQESELKILGDIQDIGGTWDLWKSLLPIRCDFWYQTEDTLFHPA